MNKIYLLIIIFLGFILLTFSCTNSDDSDLFLGEVNIKASIENNDGTTPFYIYGTRNVNFLLNSDKGNIDQVQFFYETKEIASFTTKSGQFSLTPYFYNDRSSELEMRIIMNINNKKYYKTVIFQIQYVKISDKDFELKEATIDHFVFNMIKERQGERLQNFKYILDGKIIEDLDNIIVKRNLSRFSFPTESSIWIFEIPKDLEYTDNSLFNYPAIKLNFEDKTLGNFHIGSTKFHYIDGVHQELYIWDGNTLSVFDKDMNEVKQQIIESDFRLLITPKTGLAVVQPSFKNISIYSDNNLKTLISTIDLKNNPKNIGINERDQLLNVHNSQIDVYNLYTGKLIYSKYFDNYVSSFMIMDDKLLVKLGIDGQFGTQVYKLNDNSVTFLYSFNKVYRNFSRHPINRNHIILDNTYNGFEVFNLDTQTTLQIFKGQFQSIDPIIGTLLYYDEYYGINNFDNHILDVNYNQIFTFKDQSSSTYGAFLQFNNHVIKSDRYTSLLSKGFLSN